MSAIRVSIRWTETARNGLAKLPYRVRRGLIEKADRLLESDDPESSLKALVGPLHGYYTMPYSRYRAICKIEKEELADGQVLLTITITFVATGIRKDGDKRDVYRVAQRLLDLGMLEPDE